MIASLTSSLPTLSNNSQQIEKLLHNNTHSIMKFFLQDRGAVWAKLAWSPGVPAAMIDISLHLLPKRLLNNQSRVCVTLPPSKQIWRLWLSHWRVYNMYCTKFCIICT